MLQTISRILFAFLLLCSSAVAQQWLGVLDPARASDWSTIGAGPIPSSGWATCSTVNPLGTQAVHVAATPIITAINSCPANQVVQLTAGDYYLSAGFAFTHSNFVLRGAGPDQTRLHIYGSVGCWINGALICAAGGSNMDGSFVDNRANWTAGYSRGSNTITIGANTTGSHKPAVGDMLYLDMQVDGTSFAQDTYPEVFSCIQATDCSQAATGPPSGHGSGAGSYEQFQVVEITSISAGSCPCTVGITPSIRMPNYTAPHNPVATWSNNPSIHNFGIENLRIISETNGVYGYITLFTSRSWLKNTQWDADLAGTWGSAVGPILRTFVHGFGSVNNTVRDSYTFTQTSYSDIYLSDDRSSCDNLYENNILQSINTPFENEGSCGNVYTYNYIIHNVTASGWLQPGFNNHGGGFNFTLVEGNDALGTGWDNYFGGGNFNTTFRNRFWGYQPGPVDQSQNQTYPGSNYSMYRYSNWIGNILGYSGFHTTYQTVVGDGHDSVTCNQSIFAIGLGGNCSHNSADDQHTVDTIMRWGNWDTVSGPSGGPRWNSTEVPSGIAKYANAVPSTHNLPASFIYAAKPAWWGVIGQPTIPWPAIGPDVTGGNLSASGGFAYKIPARVCFESVMLGTYGDTSPRPFNANSCYPQSSSGNNQNGNCTENLTTTSAASTQRALNKNVAENYPTSSSISGTSGHQNVFACHPPS